MHQEDPVAIAHRTQEVISSADANSAVLFSPLNRQQGLPPHLRMIKAQNNIEALQQWLQMKGKRSTATYTNYLKEGRRLILLPINDPTIYKIVKEVCRALADQVQKKDPNLAKLIRSGSTHWLRHTSAPHRVDSGQDLQHVQELLGHTEPKTTSGCLHMEKQRFQRSTSLFKVRAPAAPSAEENDAE